jgi:phage baseplate assembly protein W
VDPRISSMVNEEGQVSESIQIILSTPKSRDSSCKGYGTFRLFSGEEGLMIVLRPLPDP